jgi:hypothetical protein
MVWMLVVPWPRPMNRKMASAAQGNHPPRCARAPAEAYARPAGSGNRLPVLDSEAPKLPIHTAIAVPQYGPKAASGTWRRCQFGGSASADMDPRHSGISNGRRPAATNTALRNVRELRSCAVNRLAGAFHCPVASKPPAGAAIVRPYAAAWASAPASTAANASAIFWWPASLGCRQSVPPTRSPGPSRSWSLPCESAVQGFRCPSEGLRTAADL